MKQNCYDIKLYLVDENIYEIVVKTSDEGCWNCQNADDRSTEPGRPPMYFFDAPIKEFKILEGDIVITRLCVFFKLKGKFQAG